MTQEEFDSLSAGGLQKLIKKLTGKLSIPTKKPTLQKLAAPLAWAGVSLADIDVEPKPAKAAKTTKRKAATKAPVKAPPKKKAVVKPKAKAAKPETTDAAKARESVDAKIAKLHGEGMSLAKIAAALDKAGIKTARGGNWRTSSIDAALRRQA